MPLLLFFLWHFVLVSSAEAALHPLSISGPVEIRQAGESEWVSLQNAIPLQEGFHLRTGDSGELSLSCADGSELHLGPGTQLEILRAFFDETSHARDFRIKLVRGRLEAFTTSSNGAVFRLNQDSLTALVNARVPESVVKKLAPLVQKSFTEEKAFLHEVKKIIGGEHTVRYKLLLLESAAGQDSVFSVTTELSETAVGRNTKDSVSLVTVDEERQTVDVQVLQGRAETLRKGYKGRLTVSGVRDRLAGKGVRFSLNTAGGKVRLTKGRCNVSVESSVRLTDFQVLTGENETMADITNGKDSPPFTIGHDENSTIELAQEQAVLLYTPAEPTVDVEFSEMTNANFGFCQQVSSFVFVKQGCPKINGKENCCGDVRTRQLGGGKENPSSSPSAETPQPGGYTPPVKPPVEPGSPILP